MIVVAKLLIFLLCAFLQFNLYTVNISTVAIALVALIICTLPTIIKTDFLGDNGIHILQEIVCLIYVLVSIFLPAMRCFIPLLFIDVCHMKLVISFVVSILCMTLSFADTSLVGALFVILLALCAALFQYIIGRNTALAEALKTTRDSSKERELLIEEKNRTLRDNQDAQIYMATLKERNRIAREIHDNVGHMLTRSILQVGAIKTINTNEVLKDPLDGLHETLNTAMASIRSSVHDLHDDSIDLLSAIREITEPIDKFYVNLEYDMGHDVPRNIKYCFISIVKEAVNNAIKHSNCTNMDIIVQEHPAFYQLLIQDNGTDIILKPADGIGLTNMKDRVSSLNGNLKVSTDHGFKILISIIKK